MTAGIIQDNEANVGAASSEVKTDEVSLYERVEEQRINFRAASPVLADGENFRKKMGSAIQIQFQILWSIG